MGGHSTHYSTQGRTGSNVNSVSGTKAKKLNEIEKKKNGQDEMVDTEEKQSNMGKLGVLKEEI